MLLRVGHQSLQPFGLFGTIIIEDQSSDIITLVPQQAADFGEMSLNVSKCVQHDTTDHFLCITDWDRTTGAI